MKINRGKCPSLTNKNSLGKGSLRSTDTNYVLQANRGGVACTYLRICPHCAPIYKALESIMCLVLATAFGNVVCGASAFPLLGNGPMAEITPSELLAVAENNFYGDSLDQTT